MTHLTLPEIRELPKVLLHDHLDGGLRPQTIIDLAAQAGYADLPTEDAGELGRWFFEAASSGSLELYLQGFAHTVAVMQTAAAIRRVARESAVDLADDGVVYAEVRFAPELLTAGGLSLAEVVEAALEGFSEGGQGRDILIGTLLCAMRQNDRAGEVADLVAAYRDAGVVGFDIAGPEIGFPASRMADTFRALRHDHCLYTIHAGEAVGPESIADALSECCPQRIGHGVRIVEDIRVAGDEAELGRLAEYVRNQQIPLEVCPTSNVQTGAADSIAEHPIRLLRDLAFTVTINTDNRLMSDTTLSREMALLASEQDWTREDLMMATLNAAYAAFLPLEEKAVLVETIEREWTVG